MNNIDKQKSIYWAIANIGGGGFIVGVALFDLVNLETCRGHGCILTQGAITTQLGTASAGPISYTTFRTNKPVSFDDFDGTGARLTTGSAIIYSWAWLTLWEGAAYMSNVLAHMRMSGWTAAIPGGGFGHGIFAVSYGAGRPADMSAVQCMLNADIPDSPYPEFDHVAPKEDPIRK